MCTVTFIPLPNERFVLTSSRDEAPGRATIAPEVYGEVDVELMYPKDAVAGGTWIAASNEQRLLCLLNGGFVSHKHQPPYIKSRGVVVKELLLATHIQEALSHYELEGIEPFTLIIVTWKKGLTLQELVWTGEKRFLKSLPIAPQIWSSSTLYTEEMKVLRSRWFKKDTPKDAVTAWDFHHKAGDGDVRTNVLMQRSEVRTVSITQVALEEMAVAMLYEDIQNETVTAELLEMGVCATQEK